MCKEESLFFSVFNKNKLLRTFNHTPRTVASVRERAKNYKFKTNSTVNYRGIMEKSGASCAQQQTASVRLLSVTGNIPAPTAVNKNGAALTSVAVNFMGGQGTLSSSRQAVPVTTNVVHEDACL